MTEQTTASPERNEEFQLTAAEQVVVLRIKRTKDGRRLLKKMEVETYGPLEQEILEEDHPKFHESAKAVYKGKTTANETDVVLPSRNREGFGVRWNCRGHNLDEKNQMLVFKYSMMGWVENFE